MKTFVASLILFAILLVVVLGNCLYVRRVTKTLSERVGSLPSCGTAGAELARLRADWQAARTALSFSVPHDIIYEMEANLSELETADRIGDSSAFALAQTKLLCTICELCRNEQLSAENLF